MGLPVRDVRTNAVGRLHARGLDLRRDRSKRALSVGSNLIRFVVIFVLAFLLGFGFGLVVVAGALLWLNDAAYAVPSETCF